MNQSEFSKSAEKYIADHYPAFLETIVYQYNDSFDCKFKSKSGKLFIWISTIESEITVGFEDSQNVCNWHTHMNLFGANNPIEELIAMSELLDSIFSGKEHIIFSSKIGYTLTSDIEAELKNKDEDEIIFIYKWNEL